jgi:hypothetical protein
VDGTPLTVQYLMVVDALNFCFWPGQPQCQAPSLLALPGAQVAGADAGPLAAADGELEYHNLSQGVKVCAPPPPPPAPMLLAPGRQLLLLLLLLLQAPAPPPLPLPPSPALTPALACPRRRCCRTRAR